MRLKASWSHSLSSASRASAQARQKRAVLSEARKNSNPMLSAEWMHSGTSSPGSPAALRDSSESEEARMSASGMERK
jgi:hypothetical protein